MEGDARHGNPTLDVWLDSAYDGFRDTGGGSVEDFVAWLEGPDGPDAPTLWDYAAGERTFIGYAMDPDTLSAELHLGPCSPGELDTAMAHVQDGGQWIPTSVDSLLNTWSDCTNDMMCDCDLLAESLDEAVRRSGITVDGHVPSAPELGDAIQAELRREHGER